MNIDITELRKLSVAERLQLVEDVWDSIAADTPEALPLSAAQLCELQRRRDEHAADPGGAIAWEDVRAELLANRQAPR